MFLQNLTHLDDGMISAQVMHEDGSVSLVVFDSMEVLHKELENGRQAVGRNPTNSNRALH